ncbi:MAG: NIPSNAP family protein, partial [Rhodocyclaceae bacterium]|nr:NIPSNAP family protein [Rhodocyclaceae bacterium]
AENWAPLTPRCGGILLGYFLPQGASTDTAWGWFAFDNLAPYERYRARLRDDAEGRANFAFAQDTRFILREERSFVDTVDGTFCQAPQMVA